MVVGCAIRDHYTPTFLPYLEIMALFGCLVRGLALL